MDRGFTISNGLGWSPDARTIYFTETPVRTIYAYDFDSAGGTIANRSVRLPVQRPLSCAFGGAGLDTLYVTTSIHRLTREQIAQQPLAGGLFAIDAGVKGMPEPRFAG